MSDDDVEIPAPPQIDPQEHAALQLKVAMLEAGVDLSTEQGKIVAAANEGKTPDAEAIRAQWEAVKPKPETVPEPEPEPRIEGETDQTNVRQSLTANSTIEPNPTDVDPKIAARNAALAVMSPEDGRPSGTREDAQAAAVNVLMTAAANGDRRVLANDNSA